MYYYQTLHCYTIIKKKCKQKQTQTISKRTIKKKQLDNNQNIFTNITKQYKHKIKTKYIHTNNIIQNTNNSKATKISQPWINTTQKSISVILLFVVWLATNFVLLQKNEQRYPKKFTKSILKNKCHKHNSLGHTKPIIAKTTIIVAHVSLTVACVAKTTTQQPKQFLLLKQQQKWWCQKKKKKTKKTKKKWFDSIAKTTMHINNTTRKTFNTPTTFFSCSIFFWSISNWFHCICCTKF